MIKADKDQEAVSARRRLIRGTFAAPTVLALYSGSALAVTSNLRCLANGASVQPTAVMDSTDTYVRVQLWQQGSSNHWYLKGFDVYSVPAVSRGTAAINTTFLASQNVWREVQFGTNGTVTLGTSTTSEPGNATRGSKYIALRVAPGSTRSSPVQIVGVVDGTSTVGSAVSFNCWQSVTG